MSSSAPSGSKQSYNQFSDKQLMHDNQMLTNELIVLNQDLTKNRTEFKKQTDLLKKTEKERDAAMKNSEVLQGALDKLRKERDQMYAIVNSKKYHSFNEQEGANQEWKTKFDGLKEEMNQKEAQIQSFRKQVEELENEAKSRETKIQQMSQSELSKDKLLQSLEEKSTRLESQLDQTEMLQKHATDFVEELKQENAKLSNDVQWLAATAKNNKLQSEKAIKDLEEYAEVLKKLEMKLNMTEKQRDQKTQECMDLQNCLSKLMDSMPQLKKQVPSRSSGPAPTQPPQGPPHQSKMTQQPWH